MKVVQQSYLYHKNPKAQVRMEDKERPDYYGSVFSLSRL